MIAIKYFFDTKISAALEANDFDHANFLFELFAELETYCAHVKPCHDESKEKTTMAKKASKKKPSKKKK